MPLAFTGVGSSDNFEDEGIKAAGLSSFCALCSCAEVNRVAEEALRVLLEGGEAVFFFFLLRFFCISGTASKSFKAGRERGSKLISSVFKLPFIFFRLRNFRSGLFVSAR